MPNTQTGPYPVLFAKNTTRARINLQTTVGGTRFHRSLGPGETKEVPWVIAKSAGFHVLWTEGKIEVSDKFDFETTLDELPSIGADGGPTNWEEIEGTPEVFPPAEHTRSWDEIDGKPTEFPPASHQHSWTQVTNKPATFAPSTHDHTIAQVTDLQTALDGKVDDSDPRLTDSRDPKTHTHSISQVTGLQGALDGKSATGHSHAWADITDKPTIPPAAPVAEAQADSTAEDIAGLVEDFNSLLAKLRAAGIINT